ncbi:Flp family type IVb pilin [Celeribacter halophilus]|uniref:Pilus assembly protein Flp/PilA n=1 Tax=Celeribacter halophilus TaxID=576117 RepID=A0A1I3QNH5_9RHOB|nr:Flp family type IVb pilin [Celeribacter halophilus]PZX13371.1 pilus assembly protein Flp/PilA [Celeribacter halophilus]SFJ35405.1 pilus assembly protein Flp/PilA [Celeribacter halophilus]
MKFFKLMNRFNREEDGATAIEYGLFAALISAVIVGTVSTLGGNVKTGFETVNTAIAPATTTP